MMYNDYAVVLTLSTGHAVRIDKLLAEQGIQCILIPVPRYLSSDCGVCVRIRKSDREQVAAMIEEFKIEIESINNLTERR